MSNIEQLLKQQYEGSLSFDDEKKLNELTHRSQVLENANKRAREIRHRQLNIVGIACVVLVGAGTIFAMQSVKRSNIKEGQLIASATQKTEDTKTNNQKSVLMQEVDDALFSTEKAASTTLAPRTKNTASAEFKQKEPAEIEESEIVPPTSNISDETIVACNTQCSPDSVISDIWKFLQA